MNQLHSPVQNILLVGDSHTRSIPSRMSTWNFNITTKFITGLKWFDRFNSSLCLYSLISTIEFQNYLLQTDTVILLIGTNSVRNINASSIIEQVQKVVNFLRQHFSHFRKHEAIHICLVFPCSKVSNRFSTTFSLKSNINIYNEQLMNLSKEMHFNIIDLKITNNHLAKDHVHVNYCFQHLILDSIIDHLNRLTKSSSSPGKTYLKSEIISASDLNVHKRKRSPSSYQNLNIIKHK